MLKVENLIAMHSFNLAEAVHRIPGELEDMIVRSAYLEHSARELAQSRYEQQVRLQTVRASQPPFLFLRPKETRVAFQVAAKDSAESLSALSGALTVNKRLCEHLRASSETILEQWLATHCDEYRLALQARGFSINWDEALMRFMDHGRVFVQTLGTARNMASAGFDRARECYSSATYDAIGVARTAALALEAEIVAINSIASEHDQLLERTVFSDPMPRLVPEPYADAVSKIAGLQLVAAQAEFNRIIAAVEDLVQRELGDLRNRVRDSERHHGERKVSYVRNAWNLLYAHAVAHSVEAEHISTVVEQTERMYAKAITQNASALSAQPTS